MGRGGDVFTACHLSALDALRQRLGRTDFSQFHQHWQIDAREDFDAIPVHHRDGQIAGSTTKHVGEDDDPVPGIDLLDKGADFSSSALHVVLWTDTHSADVSLGADDVLHSRAEFVRKAAVGYQNQTDHD